MMNNKNSKLVIGLGFESSIIVKKAESRAEKFCMDFNNVYYPRKKNLTKYKDNYYLSEEDDFWWCGEDIFENLKTPVFKKLIKDKKTVVLVVSRMWQKEAGFVDAFIRYAEGKKIILILNKNQIAEGLYRHFEQKCRVIDAFYTDEYFDKVYNEDMSIKPRTSIVEMQAYLNMSFMKQIEDVFKKDRKSETLLHN